MVKEMCLQAQVLGKNTNHSLRASGITKLFQAGSLEKVIEDRSGHRSLDGLRKYERVSEEQQDTACSALLPSKPDESLSLCKSSALAFSTSKPAICVSNTYSPAYQQLQQQQPCCSFGGAYLHHQCVPNTSNTGV